MTLVSERDLVTEHLVSGCQLMFQIHSWLILYHWVSCLPSTSLIANIKIMASHHQDPPKVPSAFQVSLRILYWEVIEKSWKLSCKVEQSKLKVDTPLFPKGNSAACKAPTIKNRNTELEKIWHEITRLRQSKQIFTLIYWLMKHRHKAEKVLLPRQTTREQAHSTICKSRLYKIRDEQIKEESKEKPADRERGILIPKLVLRLHADQLWQVTDVSDAKLKICYIKKK